MRCPRRKTEEEWRWCDGTQGGGEGIRTPAPSFYRVSRPSPTTGWGRSIPRSADRALQACQRPPSRGCLPHEPPHIGASHSISARLVCGQVLRYTLHSDCEDTELSP